jgi:hypothetical protein
MLLANPTTYYRPEHCFRRAFADFYSHQQLFGRDFLALVKMPVSRHHSCFCVVLHLVSLLVLKLSSYELGNGPVNVTSDEQVDDGIEHTIEAVRYFFPITIWIFFIHEVGFRVVTIVSYSS